MDPFDTPIHFLGGMAKDAHCVVVKKTDNVLQRRVKQYAPHTIVLMAEYRDTARS